MKFKFLPHTADLKFQAWGKTLDEAFGNSANALFKALTHKKVKAKRNVTVRAEDEANEKHEINHIKAITYSEMEIKHLPNRWFCQIVLDV